MISRRALEITTALITGSFGLAVVLSSVDNGIGWSTAGVDAGTFPFLTGLIILIGSAFNLACGALRAGGIAISWLDLRHLAALFVPAAVFIGVIPLIGMYIAAGVYVFGVLSVQKHQSLPRTAVIAMAVPLALYVVFERMFQVSLPHGALADMIGL